MKCKMTLILFVLIAVLAGCGTKQEVPLTDFDNVEIRNGFTVDISVGEEYSVVFEVTEEVPEHIEAFKKENTLIIRVRPGHDTEGVSLTAEVTMPTLTALTLDNGSHVTVSGSGGDVTLSVAGGSCADLVNFNVENADVTASRGSEVTVNVSGRLDAEARGGSKIYYLGYPTLGTIKETEGSLCIRTTMIHITGIVLDADQLPREIPVVDVTILARMLRGIPMSGTQTRTHTDMEGRFELQIPMEYTIYPFWWGEIEVDAPGYEACTVLCYSQDPYVRDCEQVPYGFYILRDCFIISEDRLGALCNPGTGCFYKIGLRTSAHTPTPTPYWTLTPNYDK